MKRLKFVILICTSIIIGVVSGEVIAWTPLLTIYIGNYFSLPLIIDDVGGIILLMCTQLRVRFVVSSITTIIVFCLSLPIFLKNSTSKKVVSIEIITSLGLEILFVILVSIVLLNIELSLLKINAQDFFYEPWCRSAISILSNMR